MTSDKDQERIGRRNSSHGALAWLPRRSAVCILGPCLLLLPVGAPPAGEPQAPPLGSAVEGTTGDDLAPGPRRAVAHLRGFTATSRLRLEQAPDLPYELQVVYIFPERARWIVMPENGRESDRADTYRYGDRAWKYSARRSASTELEGSDRDAQILRMELRRAAFLWPDGFVWREVESAPDEAPREVSADVHVVAGGEPRKIGALVATLDASGRPTRIESRGGEGAKPRFLLLRKWQEVKNRTFPHEIELFEKGRRVWRETVTEVQTRVDYLDRYFQPPDARPAPDREGDLEPIRSVPLTALVVRTQDLPPRSSWKQAKSLFEDFRQAAGRELRSLGLEVESAPAFALDAEGNPTKAILSLTRPLPESLPEGWQRIDQRPGLLVVLPSVEGVNRASLSRMAAEIPAGMRADDAYLRIWSEDRIQLTLPLRR